MFKIGSIFASPLNDFVFVWGKVNKALWICVIFMLACTEFEIVADCITSTFMGTLTVVVKDHFQTVGDVIQARRCSTGPLSQLDMQIALEMECLGDFPCTEN